jgi:cellulose synthase/poly-beta-1,6-N-acetylglucosamine synthase-like glycosyltransferase
LQTTFLISVALILGVYAGYPLCITILSRLRPVRAADPAGMREWPSVSVVCAVHNEARRVSAKIATIAAQSYPGHLQMLFISDGSSDGTESILLADPRATVPAARRMP